MVRHYVGDRFTAKGDVIQLLDGAVELDTDQLEKLVKQRDWSHATPLINGPFLFGFKIPDSSTFEDWLTVERSHWDGLCVDTLLRHAEERLDAGDELSADEPITKARKLDPLSQAAVVDGGAVIGMPAVPADLDHPASAILSLARGGLVGVPGVAGANPSALAALAAQASEWAERFPQRSLAANPWTLDAAVAEVLRVTTAEQPHLLIFDDAQWIDPTSYQMIEQFARNLARAPILMVLATTPEPAPPKLAA